jgi:RimJ/RimL family protein N-acetyltransferase
VRIDGERAGVICFDVPTREISIFLHRRFRGHGYGRFCVNRFCRDLFKWGVDRVDAVVRANNSAAIRMFEEAGFKVVCRTDFVRMTRRRFLWLFRWW